MISSEIILFIIVGYFSILFIIAYFTSKRATDKSYFLGNKQSPWFIIAFGLIGDSLSGVTFVSVPGEVATKQFAYMQIVLGYVLGYFVIAKILLPLYYKMNLTSIYTYLGNRFGTNAQKTGSFYFIISRLIGAAFRLYISATVLQLFIFNAWGVPFYITVSFIILLILLYTYKGGIKTLIWTDTLQSSFLLAGVVLSIAAIASALNLNFTQLFSTIYTNENTQIFFWDWKEKNYFFKQFFSGALIAIAMTGLDQNMMQKNLSMKSLQEAQKNLYWFSGIVVIINLLFVSLGILLFIYAGEIHIAIPAKTDQLFPLLAFNYLGVFAAIVFILGITAATFSSADSVLTTLTTSFCIDILNMDIDHKIENKDLDQKNKKTRHLIHVLFAVLLLFVIVFFDQINNDTIINAVFTVAGYTYGPLLGLFAFGIFTKRSLIKSLIPFACLVSPIFCYFLNKNSSIWFQGYQVGYELLFINGILTFFLLFLISFNKEK